MTTKVFESTF